jgi:hypothetical protein
MKAATINQVNGRVQTDQTIQHYWTTKQNEGAKETSYKNDYWNFNFGRPHRTTITGTFLCHAASMQVQRLTGAAGLWDVAKRGEVVIENKFGDDFSVGLTIEVRLCGVVLLAKCCDFPSLECRLLVRSNETIQSFDIVAYYKKHHLDKSIYKEGLMRDLQIDYRSPKSKVLDHYKTYCSRLKHRPNEYNRELVACLFLEKKLKALNLIADDFFPSKMLSKFYLQQKAIGRREKPMEVRQFCPWLLMEQLTNDFDDEDELMDEAENILTESGVVYI